MSAEALPVLQGIRVIDFGQYLAGPMVAMMLADFGAEVIRVDPPEGPRWDHPANAILQRGKRSIVLNLKTDADLQSARALIGSADVVIENFRPGVMDRLGLSAKVMSEASPRLIWCSLPGFGSDDPRAMMPAWEGVICAAAGLYNPAMFNTVGDPVFSALPLASFFGAIVASHGVAAALFHRERTGLGQRIEMPLFDACFEAIAVYGENPFSGTSAMKVILAAIERRIHPAMRGKYRCRDGRFVQMSPPFVSWEKLQQKLVPAELLVPRDAESVARVVDILTKQYASRTALEWERLLQEEYGACGAAVQSTQDWLEADQHARDSKCVIELNDPLLGKTRQLGFGVTLDRTPPRVRAPRQRLDQDGQAIRQALAQEPRSRTSTGEAAATSPLTMALEGIRVVDISMLLAGPTAARVLATYGADVIKISNPASLSPDSDPLSDDHAALLGHITVNDCKKTTLINLKKLEGRRIAQRLIEQADIVHQNFTPGVAERLGFGENEMRSLKSDLIYSSLNLHAFGGYRHKYRGHEELGQMVTGLAARFGGEAGPEKSPVLVNDHATGHLAAFGVILALYHRHRAGGGQHVRASLSQTATLAQLPFMISFAGRVWDEPSGARATGWGALDRLYAAQAGHFYLAAPGPEALATLATVAGLEGIEALPTTKLEAELENRFKTLPAATWAGRINAAGLAAHVYRPMHELMEDPYIKQRGLSIVREHLGVGTIRKVGVPGRFSRTPPRRLRPVPAAGLDTVSVLEELGLGDQAGELIDTGVVSLG